MLAPVFARQSRFQSRFCGFLRGRTLPQPEPNRHEIDRLLHHCKASTAIAAPASSALIAARLLVRALALSVGAAQLLAVGQDHAHVQTALAAVA